MKAATLKKQSFEISDDEWQDMRDATGKMSDYCPSKIQRTVRNVRIKDGKIVGEVKFGGKAFDCECCQPNTNPFWIVF